MSIEGEIKVTDQPNQPIVSWLLTVSSALEITFVVFLTVKEIFKESKNSYILKD